MAKEIVEGTIYRVDTDGAEVPSFFVYIRVSESDKNRKEIDELCENSRNELIEVNESAYTPGKSYC